MRRSSVLLFIAMSSFCLVNTSYSYDNPTFYYQKPKVSLLTMARQGIVGLGALAAYSYTYPQYNRPESSYFAGKLLSYSIKAIGMSQCLNLGLNIAKQQTLQTPNESFAHHIGRTTINAIPAFIAPLVAFNAVELKNDGFSIRSILKKSISAMWLDCGLMCTVSNWLR